MKLLLCVGLGLLAPGLYAQTVPAAPAPLTLAECRTLALSQNQRLTSASRKQQATEAAYRAAQTSRLLKLDFTSTGYFVRGVRGTPLQIQGITGGLALNQAIYAGGRVRTQIALSGLNTQVAAEDVRNTQQQLVVETDQTYWQAVALREQVALATGNRAQLQALVRNLDNRFQAGIGYKADLLRAQVQLRDAEVRLLRTRDEQRLSRLVLSQLIGRPAEDSLRLAESIEGDFAPVGPADYAQRALAQRPELRQLALANQADSLQIVLARSARLPQIGGSVNTLYLQQKPSFLLPETSYTPAYAVVSLNLPLVHWRENRLLEAQRRYQAQASQADLAEARQQVELEISRDLLRLNQAARRVALQRLSVAQAQENQRLNDNRFRAGLLSLTDLLEAQTVTQQAAAALVDAKAEYRIAEAALVKATGE